MKTALLALALGVSLNAVAAGNDNDRLKLIFDRPAGFFEESLVIGNGNLGAIIYGGTDVDRISLNDITLWTGEPEGGVTTPEAYKAIPEICAALDRGDYRAADSLQQKVQGHYSENYQPLGSLTIRYEGNPPFSDGKGISDYKRVLDISDAVASRSFSVNGRRQHTDYFASAPDSVIVLRIKNDSPVDVVLTLDSQLPHKAVSSSDGAIRSLGHAAYLSLPGYTSFEDKLKYDPERGTRFCTIAKAVPVDGKIESLPDGSLRLKDVTDAVVYITNVTSFNGFDRDPVKEGRDYKGLAERRIGRAVSKGYEALLAAHKDDYKALFSRVELDLGATDDSIAALPTDVQLKRYTDFHEANPDLEELYFQYGRYLLISCSRTKAVPANLQGLWNEYILPPWSSNYTTNINVEENYWPAEVTGLGELHATALIPWIENLSKGGRLTARHYYGVDRGWSLGHNSDIWAMTNPVGLNSGDPTWANWTMGGAWLASHIWEHYLFTPDKDYLERYYPVLKGAAEFCLGWLVEKDGRLITSPANSPENKYVTPEGYVGATMYGGAADLAMVRQCLMDARDAAATLGIDSVFRAEVDSVLPKLYPYQIGRKGNLQEWYFDWDDQDPTHRHQSHLYGLFPGRHISVDSTPELARAAARTLDIKGDNTTGWSTGWRVNLLARLRDKEGAYHMYRRLLQYVSPDNYDGPDKRGGGGTYPNLLDAHAPFQIDGNFGGAAGVAEMLIQSSPESIVLLPALPEEWRSGSVSGLRARGGFVVDIAWKEGKLISADIRTCRGGKTKVHFPDGEIIDVELSPGELRHFE